MDLKKFFSGFVFGFFGCLVVYMSFYMGSFNKHFRNDWQISELKTNFENKNLTILDLQLSQNEFMSDRNLTEFSKFINSVYFYDKNNYDCKFWALEWGLYAIKHNIEYEFLTTKTHIFIKFDYPDKYCIIDGKQVDCKYYKK